MDYKATLNLPKTEFPMKANLAAREPEIQARWREIDLYRKTLERPAPRGRFILHDGPPYSNGNVHIGTIVQNKVPKDFIVRYRTMRGYFSPYVPGWDTHGLPIENNVAREFMEKKHQPSKLEFRRRCREYALESVDIQREQFLRYGITGDWWNPYLTLSNTFEATIVRVFGELAARGSIYRGLKPIHWCPVDRTALADHEIEYEDHVSDSVYVRFPLRRDPRGRLGAEPVDAVIWTTTPWTLPANMAVAVHPDFEYAVVEQGGARFLLAEGLLETVAPLLGWTDPTIVTRLPGRELEGIVFGHPLFDRDSPVVLADYVTLDTGTGVVHTAPGHGREDFMTGQRYGLETLCPVDESGRFTEDAGPFAGLDLAAGNRAVMAALDSAGALLRHERYRHSYPHCWRCHQPVIFRATTQWFLSIDDQHLREWALDRIKRVEWFPAETERRITAMVAGRPDWCLSRQRSWGVALPVFYCEACAEPVVTPESIESVRRQVEEHNSDIWFEKSAAELLPEGFACPNCSADGPFRKEEDVLDVWFDSGSTCRAVLETRPELSYPADLYLEGNDQHRGWFNSSLILGVATTGEAPYRQVVTHGMTVDDEGKKLSKSKGNFVHPMEMAKRYGADVLRLASASYDYFGDMRLGEEALKGVGETYRRLRNTFRFLLGNLYDYDPLAHGSVELQPFDRWILHRLDELVTLAAESYDRYEFHPVTTQLINFVSIDLSALYLDVLKDRLYLTASDSADRRSAQRALWHLAETLARLTAPVLVHTSEEVWQQLRALDSRLPESVHLADFPSPNHEWRSDALAGEYSRLAGVRDAVNKALEDAKIAGSIGQPREAQVDLRAGDELYALLDRHRDELPGFLIVSGVDLSAGDEELVIAVSPASGERCVRCWLVRLTVGSDGEHAELCETCASVVRRTPVAACG